MHLNVTYNPTAEWTALQLRQAFPFETAPRFLIRDRDGIYGNEVEQAIKQLGMEGVVISPRSPWQNGYGGGRWSGGSIVGILGRRRRVRCNIRDRIGRIVVDEYVLACPGSDFNQLPLG